jgi:hypothetical protein
VQDDLASAPVKMGKLDIALFDREEPDRRIVLVEQNLTAPQARLDRKRPNAGG